MERILAQTINKNRIVPNWGPIILGHSQINPQANSRMQVIINRKVGLTTLLVNNKLDRLSRI
jgi:hypothetical protein